MDNQDKMIHGLNLNDSIKELLTICLKRKYISDYHENCYYSKEKYYCPYVVHFENGDIWLIYRTTSLRDRIKQSYWDCHNIRLNNPAVTQSILVYPGSCVEKERKLFEGLRDKIKNRSINVPIDHVVPDDLLIELIENYYCFISQLSEGSRRGRLGFTFEYILSSTLNYKENLNKWLFDTSTSTGMYYGLFSAVLDRLENDGCVNRETLYRLHSTNEIDKLPSGGSPKTDVLLKVQDKTGTSSWITFSCKLSRDNKVSVHEYDCSSFANVLNNEDARLRELLELFQRAGNLKEFGQENTADLTSALSPYKVKLARWVLGGIGGEGNPDTQWAKYLILKNKNLIKIHTIDEYIELMEKSGVRGTFGTFFDWTYSSGRKGKTIQLKMKLLW